MPRSFIASAAFVLLSACVQPRAASLVDIPPQDAAPAPGWHAMVSPDDRALIDGLPDIWGRILRAVPARHRPALAAEGELLQPAAARQHPMVPPGSYHCRLVRLQPADRTRPVQSFKEFFCYVRGEEDNQLSFTKQTGTELPGGWLHADGDRRLVLVGAKQREAGDNSLSYGDNPGRNLVGAVERTGPFRWRLVLPQRTGKSLDVYELTPVPPEQQAPEPPAPEPSAPAATPASEAEPGAQ